MATPSYGFFGLTSDDLINATTHGYYWKLNADRTIDWSISDGFGGEFWSNPDTLQTQISGSLSTFSYYANVKFNYVGYFTTPTVAASYGSEINISLSAYTGVFPSSNIWAKGYFNPSSSTDYTGEVGDVFLNLNSSANKLSTYAPGSAGWFVFIHELGHTIGLKHPHDNGGTGRPTAAQVGLANLNTDWSTIMSYQDTYDWNLRTWDPATPMIMDVIALQYIYGKNMATNAGDTTFTLSLTNMYQTLWDASGNDTVSVSSQVVSWDIELPRLQPSALVDTKFGAANPVSDDSLRAPTTLYWLAGDMENVIGGYGNDIIKGNDFANILIGGAGSDQITGGGGDDYIDGGIGIDFANYAKGSAEFEFGASGSSRYVTDKSGALGRDTLLSVERFKFSDKNLAFDLSPTQNAGMALEFIGVFAPSLTKSPSVVGSILNIFDQGTTLHDAFQIAINSGLVKSIAGSNSNSSVASMVYRNLIGSEPTQAIVDSLVGYMDGRFATYSQADFLTVIANLEINQLNVGLVGLQQSGVDYL